MAFEGRIQTTLTQGNEMQTLTYTVGTNQMRIERGESNRPYARDIINLDTGEITLLFPHNRSFVRLKNTVQRNVAVPPAAPGSPPPPANFAQPPMPVSPQMPAGVGPQMGDNAMPSAPGMPAMPPMPAGVGPQAGAGAMPAAPAMPAMGAMPMMPMMPMPGEAMELKATGETTNLLGCACARYELRQRGEIMEIWATDKLLPFRSWLQNQPPRFSPQMIEEKWGDLILAQKLFPLLAVLKFEGGGERLRFEVKTITPQKIEDKDGALYQPPADYHEIEPLPF